MINASLNMAARSRDRLRGVSHANACMASSCSLHPGCQSLQSDQRSFCSRRKTHHSAPTTAAALTLLLPTAAPRVHGAPLCGCASAKNHESTPEAQPSGVGMIGARWH